MLDQLAWPDAFNVCDERLVDPLENVTEPTVTGLPDEVTVAVSVTELPTLIVALESEREVDVAAWVGGVVEDELLPHDVATRGTASKSATEVRGIRISVFIFSYIQPVGALPLFESRSPGSAPYLLSCFESPIAGTPAEPKPELIADNMLGFSLAFSALSLVYSRTARFASSALPSFL